MASYSSADGANYFGWPLAAQMDARKLAETFVGKFPILAKRGTGRDWRYAGWLTDVLGRAEQGGKGALLVLETD